MSPPVVMVLYVLVSKVHNTHKIAFDKFFIGLQRARYLQLQKWNLWIFRRNSKRLTGERLNGNSFYLINNNMIQ
jgi:hypothetical protein